MVRQRIIIERVLARSDRKGWDRRYTADVMVAALSPARVAAGVVGPCFYCFDEMASTVDHLVPVAEGGTDDRLNLVSACLDCNLLKFTTELRVFLNQRPFGSDLARQQRVRDSVSPEMRRRYDEWLRDRADRYIAIHGSAPGVAYWHLRAA